MTRITPEELSTLRGKHPGKTIVFCSGAFDIIHAGHVLFLESCKGYGDILVVMVGSDRALRRYKKEGRPVLNEYVRMKMMDSLRPVDYCLLDDAFHAEGEHLLTPLSRALNLLRPDAYVVNDDAFDMSFRENLARQHGARMVILPRSAPPEFENISTTSIIKRIRGIKK